MLDRFQRNIHSLRLSVTDLCNLRCVYCMPAEGVPLKPRRDILAFEEIEELVRAAAGLGFTKIRLTGGEPLVRNGILDLVRRVGRIPGITDYAMTTNGILLPRFAQGLKEAGLHRINISLDCVDPERFRAVTRCGRVQDTLAGIEAALAAGFRTVKLNCVVNESPDEPDARAVADLGRRLGLTVRFIRRMDTARGEFWPVFGGDGGRCGICNRIRVASDGRIYPCLFSDLNFSVRELGAERALRAAVEAKPAAGCRSENTFYALGG